MFICSCSVCPLLRSFVFVITIRASTPPSSRSELGSWGRHLGYHMPSLLINECGRLHSTVNVSTWGLCRGGKRDHEPRAYIVFGFRLRRRFVESNTEVSRALRLPRFCHRRGKQRLSSILNTLESTTLVPPDTRTDLQPQPITSQLPSNHYQSRKHAREACLRSAAPIGAPRGADRRLHPLR